MFRSPSISFPLLLVGLACAFFSITGSTAGQTTIPSTPFEAEAWLKNSSNHCVKNKRGFVTEVSIDYVPRVFVVGDLDVFPHLESLSVSDTGRFYDRHMSGIARLKKLKKISFRRCDSITEASLSVLRFLPELEELNLANCEAVFSLAPLSHCSKLTRFTFSSNNHFDFTGLEKLNLKNLTSLDLNTNTNLEDFHLSPLVAAKNLEKLNLGGCTEITDEGMKFIQGLSQLKELNFSGCKNVTGSGLAFVSDQLEALNFAKSGLDAAGMKLLGSFSRIKKLKLDYSKSVSEFSLSSLADLNVLEELSLGGLDVTKVHFSKMTELNTLKKLSLSGCNKITGEGILCLKNSVDLEELILTSCRRIDDPDIEPLTNFKNLKRLILAETRVGTEGVEQLKKLPDLEELDLSKCLWVDDETVSKLVDVPSLKKINLRELSRLSDASLQSLGQLPNLEELLFFENKKITGEGLGSFEANAPLKRIELLGLDLLTPEGLKMLARLQNLEHFEIASTKLTSEHLLAMQGMPKVVSFELDDINSIDRRVYQKWVNSLPSYRK